MNKQEGPPIQDVQVIELRQKSRNATTYSNPDYRVDLDKKIEIKENDIVRVKSVFVDSVAINDNKITIEPDVKPTDPNFTDATELERNYMKITTHHNLYYRNWGYTFEEPNTQRDIAVRELPQIDGKDYIATYIKDRGGQNVSDVTGIKFTYGGSPGGKKFADPVHINLQYTTVAGATNYIKVQVPQKIISKQRKVVGEEFFILDADTKLASGSHKLNFPITCIKDSITISQKKDKHQDSNKTQLHDGGLRRDDDTIDIETANTTNSFLEPMDFVQDFYLRAGDYSKMELARELTILFGQFTEADGQNQGTIKTQTFDNFATGEAYPNDIRGNTFLCSAKSLRLTRGNGVNVGTIADTNGRPYFVRVDSKNAFQFKKEDLVSEQKVIDYWIGSDEGIAFDYNQELDKFEIIQTHMSLRDKNQNSMIVACEVGDDTILNNKFTGIYFKNLEPEDFWFNKLKFDKSVLVSDSKMITLGSDPQYPTWDDAEVRSVPNLETQLIDGVTTTGDFLTQTALTFKGNLSARYNADNSKTIADGGLSFDRAVVPLSFEVVTNQTNSILADKANDKSNSQDHENKAYFKIEIDMGINNDIVGGKFNPRIKSIINRYYSVDSYTTSYSEGDITYQHKGAPLQVSDIGIRILNPDDELSQEIGDSNSVFLEIIKEK